MKRRAIAEVRVIGLKLGPLRSTLSHYMIMINFLRLCFPEIRRNLSENFEHVLNLKTLQRPTNFRIVSDEIAEGLKLPDVVTTLVLWGGGGGGVAGRHKLKIV